MKMKKLSEHSNAAAALLSAMANPKRLMILCNLVNGEITVGVLANQVGLSQSALSQHLSKLRAQKLVKTRRDAQTIYYSSNSSQVLTLLAALGIVLQNPDITRRMIEGTPLKRLGVVEDISATAVYLASEAGSYVTGRVLEVDGGIRRSNLDMGLPDLV